MKLATRKSGRPDGELMVVSRDCAIWASAAAVAPSLQAALEDWDRAAPALATLGERLDRGELAGEAYAAIQAACPLPRAYQWLDGSAYLAHGRLMTRAFKLESNAQSDDAPLMYQGMSDRFIAPTDDVDFVSEEHGIDFEGEFAVIVDEVPMGTGAAHALRHIKLLMLANDWSCRGLAPREMKSGFGFVQAKPTTSFAPLALTPDELGEAWNAGRIDLTVRVWRDGVLFGAVPSAGMDYDFGQLIEHAAATRTLSAGTIIGSGTVSVGDPLGIGSCCISERRGGELIEYGEPRTNYLRFSETVRVEAFNPQGIAPFGAIEQTIARHEPPCDA